jgi:hypothetical protein
LPVLISPVPSLESRAFEFCAGLVDLVVCVGRHGGGGHRLALAGERFVDLIAEDSAEVGDRGWTDKATDSAFTAGPALELLELHRLRDQARSSGRSCATPQ